VFARPVGIGKGSGVEIAQDEAHLWTLEDGKMLLAVSYIDREQAVTAAGLRAGS
jgi:ketosteroid isomerase-like protein